MDLELIDLVRAMAWPVAAVLVAWIVSIPAEHYFKVRHAYWEWHRHESCLRNCQEEEVK